MKRVVVVTLWVMSLGWAFTSAVQPAVSASAVVPAAAPVVHHKTARLCSTVVSAGQAACYAIRQTDTVQPPGVTANAVSPNATPAGYGPSTLVAAYKLDRSKGSGQTVAVVDAYDDPNAESDLAVYRTQYGLPACTTANGCFKKVNQSGSTTNLPRSNAGWAGEISLDLDMVSATCPNCHILLVEATSSTITNLGTAVNQAVTLGAKFVSNSYGGSEFSSEPSYDSAYYHHAGVAITASTGDTNYGAQYPATGAYVTAVGGTSLTSAGNTRGWTETVWKTSSTEGTGLGTPNGTAGFTGVNIISVTNPGTQTNTAANSLSLQIQASDSGSGATLTYTATGLPPGLVINSGTGLISGTPSTTGSYTVTATATDGSSASGSTTFSWVIQALVTAPGAPTGVTAVPGDASAAVSW